MRDSCACQYISGSSNAAIPWVHLGGLALGSMSGHTVCHPKSISAETPASCFRTFSQGPCCTGNPCVASHVSSAWSAPGHWRSTPWDVRAGRGDQRPGGHRQRQLGARGARGSSHGLPVLPLALADLDHGLGLLSLVTAWMRRRPRRQALPSLCQGLRGLPQTTAESQRLALGQRMAEGQHIRETQAVQASLRQLDQGLGSLTH